MRIYGRCDWGRLARIHALDTRQYRAAQACTRPGRGGSNTVLVKDCAALLDPARSLLGAAQERWLADGWSRDRRWNLLAQQTLFAPWSWRDPAGADSPGGMVWTDGWSGYPVARQRLLDGLRDRRVDNVVIFGGDMHANIVADVRTGGDSGAVVASEFCGTSISSEGMAQERLSAAMPFNPHIRHARSDQRGYVRVAVATNHLQVRLRVVDDPLDAASGITTVARFAVAAGKPGVEVD
jgi:alkaline phosphatase D